MEKEKDRKWKKRKKKIGWRNIDTGKKARKSSEVKKGTLLSAPGIRTGTFTFRYLRLP